MGNSLKGVGEVIIAKHRNSSLDSVFLKFIGKYTKFADLDNNEFGGFSNEALDAAAPSYDMPSKTLGSKINDFNSPLPPMKDMDGEDDFVPFLKTPFCCLLLFYADFIYKVSIFFIYKLKLFHLEMFIFNT
jgi:replicative DNA helicase